MADGETSDGRTHGGLRPEQVPEGVLATRPRRPGARITRLSLRAAERELLVWRRTLRSSLFSAVIEPLLYLGAMGIGLGGLIDENTGDLTLRSGATVSYLEFVAPGLLVASTLLAYGAESLWGMMAATKWMGQYRSMVHTAMTPGDVYTGRVIAGGVRAGVAAVGFVLVATLLGGFTSPFGVLAIPVAMLTAAGAVAALAAYSSGKDDDHTFPLIARLGIFPLFLMSGTFFPVEQLPDALQPAVWISPVFHAAELARMSATGVFTSWALLHLAVLVAVIAVALPIGARRLTRTLTP